MVKPVFASAIVSALFLAAGALCLAPGTARAQSSAKAANLDQTLNNLSDAQLGLALGNARVQADENARLRDLDTHEQIAAEPGLRSNHIRGQDLNTGGPLMFEDHRDVRHDDLDR